MTFCACGVPLRPLDAGVDVLGVLAEDHDVHPLGVRHRRRRAGEVAHRPHAGVQIEHLPQRDVQAADAAADRRRQRSLDGDLVGPDRLERVVRQPLAVLVLRLLAGGHLEPRDPLLAAERLLHRGVEHAHAGAPDVGAGAVAFDERNDRDRRVRRGGRSCRVIGGAGGRRFEDRKIRHKNLGHITVTARLDLHRNCGKACGNQTAVRTSPRVNPQFRAVCTTMVRALTRRRAHTVRRNTTLYLRASSEFPPAFHWSLANVPCTLSSPINSPPLPSNSFAASPDGPSTPAAAARPTNSRAISPTPTRSSSAAPRR